VEEKHSRHEPIEEVINKNIPWAYFDGASQGNPPKGGARGILHLSSTIVYPSKQVLGRNLTIFVN
jgi:hypothetical protein